MSDTVNMPRLSDSMEEGMILAWLKSVGDEVAVGEELVEIETDKANMVYESDLAGTLIEIVAAAESTVAVGDVIAHIGEPGEVPSAPNSNGSSAAGHGDASESPTESTHSPAPEPGLAGIGSEEGSGRAGGRLSPSDLPSARVKASPLARRMAADLGVALGELSGSGPGGRVIKADVLAASAVGDGDDTTSTASPVGEGETETVALNRLQKTIARRMVESKTTIPHFYLSTEIDMSRCMSARARIKATAQEGAVVPSFNDMVVKACAIALREHPKANGSYAEDHFEFHPRVNVGVAVAAEGALVVPVIPDTDRKGLVDIASETRSLAAKVRDGSISPQELSGGTFTVSNLGMFGVSNFEAVVNPGQAAILAVGAIEEKPVVREGQMVPGQIMGVTLSCDHRILYGAEGAEFLRRIKTLLEEPLSLAL